MISVISADKKGGKKMKVKETSCIQKRGAISMISFSAFVLIVLMAVALIPSQKASACTAITLNAGDGSVIQARTQEWGAFNLDSDLMVTPRGIYIQSNTPDTRPGLKWKSKYGTLGVNGMHVPMYIDGMNEEGLSVSVLYLPGMAKFEPYKPEQAHKSINPIDLPMWILTKFATVDEVRNELPKIRVVGVPQKELGGIPAPVHWLVTDQTGKTIVIEYTDEKMHIYDNPVGVLTNSPEFPWHLINLSNYVGLQAQARGSEKIGELEVAPLGAGSGLAGLPGDFTPVSRFIRAAALRNTVRPLQTGDDAAQEAFRILNSFDIPLGAVASPAKDIIGSTQWITAMDTKALRYYYRTQYNYRLRIIDLKTIDFNKGTIRCTPMDREKKQDYEIIGIE